MKIASGGLAEEAYEPGRWSRWGPGYRHYRSPDKQNKVLLQTDHFPQLSTSYISSGRAANTLTSVNVSVLIAHEYMRVQEIATFPLPEGEKIPLYARPVVFDCVTDTTTAYYLLERLNGPTMRALLTACQPTRDATPSAADTVARNFAPLVSRLLRYMHYLLQRRNCFHGDLKPENMVLVRDADSKGSEASYRIRLIDPIARTVAEVSDTFTLAYNPGEFIDWRADLISILLILVEISSGTRVFDRLRLVNTDTDRPYNVLEDNIAELFGHVEQLLPSLRGQFWELFTAERHHSAPPFPYNGELLAVARLLDTPERWPKFTCKVPAKILP